MWILILVFNAIALFVFYRIFSERAAKSSGLTEIIDRFKKEINSVSVNFNRISSDNITLLEEKSLEVRELLKLINGRIEEYKRLAEKYGALERQMTETLPASARKTTKVYVPEASVGRQKRQADETLAVLKAERVLKSFDEGKTVDRIARDLDISEHEVRYYLKRASES